MYRRYTFGQEERENIADLWKAGDKFFLQVEVGSPYAGCRWEPNIYLVNPVRVGQDQGTVEALYASGHGWKAPAKIWSYGHLVTALEEGELDGMRWEYVWATPLGPINEVLSVNARYWMQALARAGQDLHLRLTWTCEECGRLQTYSAEYPPVTTSSYGDGGVGLLMEHVVCSCCLEAGSCRICESRGATEQEAYHGNVAGIDICEFCLERLVMEADLIINEVALSGAVELIADGGDAAIYCEDRRVDMEFDADGLVYYFKKNGIRSGSFKLDGEMLIAHAGRYSEE